MLSKLAFNQETLRSQEAAFIQHYDWLMSWALALTHDRARAEDLVQDAFAAFATAHTDRSAVQNMRGYLYRTLRNIHVSEARVVSRSQRALGHSLELKQLSSRFSAAELGELTPSAQTKWASLVRNHAEAVEILDDASLLMVIERLHVLVLATDQVVRASCAGSSAAASAELVKGSQFRLKLMTSIKIADENSRGGGQ